MKRMGTCLVLVAVAAACGGSGTPSQGEVAKAQQDLAKAGEQMAKDIAAGKPVGGDVKVVQFESLVPFLPQVAGWQRHEPKGETATVMGFTTSQAEADYEKGDDSVRIAIIDSSANQMILGPMLIMLRSGYSQRDGTEYTKATTIAGLPAYEQWDSETKDGEVGVVAGGRFIVKVSGRAPDITAIRQLAEAVNYSGLAAAK
jgi:hypothetical protein